MDRDGFVNFKGRAATGGGDNDKPGGEDDRRDDQGSRWTSIIARCKGGNMGLKQRLYCIKT